MAKLFDVTSHSEPLGARRTDAAAATPTSPDDPDLEGMTRPLLDALTQMTGLEVAYVTTFDWTTREQIVLFASRRDAHGVTEGMRLPLPKDLEPETFAGVTRSPQPIAEASADSWIAKRLGFETYVSVPVTLARHELFGMLCGASRGSGHVSEAAVTVMESFARMITERVSRDRAAKAESRASIAEGQLRDRARYIAMAEHELKTHLTVLEGTSLTIRDRWTELSDETRTELAEAMVRKARDLSFVVEQLLLEAREQVRAREFHPIQLDVTALVRNLVEAYDALSGSHQVSVEAARGIDAFLDPAAIDQALGHLLDNAIKFSPEGGSIRVQVRRTPQEIQIDVADEGMGLPPGVDVFEAFSRSDGSGGPVAGIGLGLHIVRSLVRAMSGHVSATRNPGGGSTFHVRLPA